MSYKQEPGSAADSSNEPPLVEEEGDVTYGYHLSNDLDLYLNEPEGVESHDIFQAIVHDTPCCDCCAKKPYCHMCAVVTHDALYYVAGGLITLNLTVIACFLMTIVSLFVLPFQLKKIVYQLRKLILLEFHPRSYQYRYIQKYRYTNKERCQLMLSNLLFNLLSLCLGIFHLLLSMVLLCSIVFMKQAFIHYSLSHIMLYPFSYEIVSIEEYRQSHAKKKEDEKTGENQQRKKQIKINDNALDEPIMLAHGGEDLHAIDLEPSDRWDSV